MTKAAKNFDNLFSIMSADLEKAALDLNLHISDAAMGELRPNTEFDVIEDVRPSEERVILSPDVHTPEEAEKALEEETKGKRPYATTTFKLKSKTFLLDKLKGKGITGVQ